jgi:beta-1,4-mannosyl-glycoprotein beta-1,4-N-acetylglucosaminyltransferase
MKIYDSFMFFDEEMLLDLRLNIMSKYVDKFIITEATFMHSGKPKKLIFDINKFSKFKDKIIYKIVDKEPADLEVIYDTDNDKKDTRGIKLVNNSNKREHHQRNMSFDSLKIANPEDIVLINDIDEIPDLSKFDLRKINKKIIMFNQKVFLYKFNLLYQNLNWHGTRACKIKHLISPQWLRDVKHKVYSSFRLDILFSKRKYHNIHHVKNGGWHFSNIKSPEDIEKKLSNFLHQQEFEYSGLNLNDIKNMVKNKKTLYDYSADQTNYKMRGSTTLQKVNLNLLPDYIRENKKKYYEWLEN